MRLSRFRRSLLCGASRKTMAFQLPEIHILTLETIMLRVGFKLGFLTVAGAATDTLQ